ncbi:MAG: formylglycine-generating enzyme family protein [Chromatiaceae bacterium]|nr:formylglycine-generating enzyme family protein [Chromatiaceae bacterium]
MWRLACLLCLIQPPGALATEADPDIVVLRNGDIHQGTLQTERLAFTTPYGPLSLPLERLTELRAGPAGAAADRLLTIEGEGFTGTLTTTELALSRVDGPALQISAADVAQIRFTPRRSRPTHLGTPDLVETRDGDLFRARVLDEVIHLRNAAGTHEISISTVHLLDLQPEQDGLLHAQVRFTIHGIHTQGVLLDKACTVETRSGDRLTLPASALAAVAFRVLPTEQDLTGHLSLVSCRHSPCVVIRDPLRDGTLGPEMVALRAGSFIRGDLHVEGRTDEQPPTPVTLARPFAIGKYELTFEEYDRFAVATGRTKPDDSGWGRGRRPVINVSWNDAVAYGDWLSEQTGQRYRLPTDAEWEYAARGGTDTRFWWGDELGTANANCAGCGSLWDARGTAPVGRFPPNPFGVYDTAGNVFEWVADCYHETFAVAPADGSAYENPAGCGQRVYRGGSWGFPPREIRSSNRWRDFPTGSSDDMGFRLVRELAP